MKVLHTSDWHLGQNFMNKSREAEHKAFLDWLLVQLNEQEIDTLVVAGDIFDTGTPPSYARTIYFDFLKQIRDTGCRQVVIVGGNHDSVSTLNESKGVLEVLDIIVVGGAVSSLDDVAALKDEVFVLKNRQGEEAAVICAVPYLRDRDVRRSEAGESADDKAKALRDGITAHYKSVYEHAQVLSEQHNDIPIMATGHLTTAGGELSEGVRELYIGTLEGYASDRFPTGFDYIALGHLHKKQIMGKNDHIRYSGSPIPLSFIEAGYDRTVNVVALTRGEKVIVDELVVPRVQQLKSIRGTMDRVCEQLSELAEMEFDGEERIWLEIVVEGADLEIDLTARLETLTAEMAVDILRIKRMRKSSDARLEQVQSEKLHELQPAEVFAKRLENEELDDVKVKAMTTLFKQAYALVEEEL